MTILLVIQVLHIMSGTIWICSFLFIYFILWPSFVHNNTAEALAIKDNLKKPIRNILGIAGVISISLGFVRGTFFGSVNSLQSLQEPYGRTFIAAIIVSFLMLAIGRFFGHNLVTIPWNDKIEKKNTLVRIYSAGTFILLCYALLIFCMVAMRFGGI